MAISQSLLNKITLQRVKEIVNWRFKGVFDVVFLSCFPFSSDFFVVVDPIHWLESLVLVHFQ